LFTRNVETLLEVKVSEEGFEKEIKMILIRTLY